jgi:hypothetical protein
MSTLHVISPINRIKVIIGSADIFTRTATINIKEDHLFHQAEGGEGAVGIDEKIYPKKDFDYCEHLIFSFWDGRKFKISKEDFLAHCWPYPPKEKTGIKAGRKVFCPKLMISLSNLENYQEKPLSKDEESQLLFKQGILS